MDRKFRSWRAGVLLSFLLGILSSTHPATSQTTAAWTWIGGADTANQSGIYGTPGQFTSSNIPSGRWNATTWTDTKGSFWLFGGSGYSAATNSTGVLLDDLWQFSSSSNQWARMNDVGGAGTAALGFYGTLGMPAAGNSPGSRSGALGWVDHKNNFWLFGGSGFDSAGKIGALNDLWEYNPTTNEWTWVGGSDSVDANNGSPGVYGILGVPAPKNTPGSRSGAVSWTDGSGNFWLFGGDGFDADDVSGVLNDLWEFDLSTDEWVWMGGSDTIPKKGAGWPGIYGIAGVSSATNYPGSRSGSIGWKDDRGDLWLFGGSGFDENGNPTALNDLWKFGFSTKEWTWISGGAAATGCIDYQGVDVCGGQPGIYGALGTSSTSNIPGGRSTSASWIDGGGRFWLFGGQGYDSAANQGNLNDLWNFNPSANDWTWLSGNTTEIGCLILTEGNTFCKGQPGEYGAVGIPGPGNDPGARFGAATWVDKQGSLWLFGGYGVDSAGNNMGVLNDLWEYQQSTNALPPAATPIFNKGTGTYSSGQTVSISDSTADATIYFTNDGSAPTTASKIYSGPIAISSPEALFSETIEAIAIAGGYSSSPMASATYTIKAPPDFSVTASPDSMTLTAEQSAAIAITVSPVNGFNAMVSFSCSGLPSEVSCSFSPNIVTPQSSPISTTLTVTTSGATAPTNSPHALSAPMAFAPLLCILVWKKRWSLQRVVPLTICAIGLGLLCGCGTSLSSHSSTTAVTVIATSGSLQHKSSFKLNLD